MTQRKNFYERISGKTQIVRRPKTPNKKPERTLIPKNINLNDFIQTDITGLNGNKVSISKFEFPGLNNLNWEETHFKLNENGLYMPTPEIFMPYFRMVLNTYHNKGKLYDLSGKEIPRKELKDIYLHLTKDHIAAYEDEGGDQKGAWTWLNAKFIEEDKEWYLEKARVQGDGLKYERTPLEAHIRDDCYVDLKFNSQGIPTNRSKTQEYKQGKNIYFYYPLNGAVVRFSANSGRVGLNCFRNPWYSNSSFGVFACAEGTSRKKIN